MRKYESIFIQETASGKVDKNMKKWYKYVRENLKMCIMAIDSLIICVII